METTETFEETSGILAVVAAVRNRAAEIRGNLGPKNLWEERVERAGELFEIADRIEAAHKREIETVKFGHPLSDEPQEFDPVEFDKWLEEHPEVHAGWDKVADPVAEIRRMRGDMPEPGNTAKIREALWEVSETLIHTPCEPHTKERQDIIERINAALKEPARNCDLHDKGDAHAAWEASGTRRAFSDWLLSEAGEDGRTAAAGQDTDGRMA